MPRPKGAITVIREALIDNPNTTDQAIEAKLRERGLVTKLASVKTLRSDVLQTLKMLARKRLLVEDYARSLNGAAAE
jgi:hypothetical protein